MARKLQEEEERSIDAHDSPVDDQLVLDQKLAMEAQDAELARMLQDKERAKVRRARERARQKKLERQQQQQQYEDDNEIKTERPDKLDLSGTNERSKIHISNNYMQKMSDPEEIQVLESVEDDVPELSNVATIIDPTYSGSGQHSVSSNSSNSVSPSYILPASSSSSQDFMLDPPCYMPIQGQRRSQLQSPTLSHEEKQKRRVKDGCKQQ